MTTDATREHCLDAEILAAWADRGLPAADAARVELHLSDCERCQEVLAAFVRSHPAPAVVIAFWSRPPVRLGAAGLAVAASVALLVWTNRPPVIPAPQATVASSDLAPSAPAPSLVPVPVAEPPAPAATVPTGRPRPAVPVETRKSAAKVVPAPAPPPPATLPPAPQPIPPPVQVTAAAPTVGGIAARPPTISAARQTAVVSDSMAERVSAELATIEIVAPDPRATAARVAARGGVAGGRGGGDSVPARWRILAGSRVQRSVDGGITWTPANLPATRTLVLTAGSAASQTVCWLVGQDGAVFVTRNGLTFERLPSPDSGHLKSVQAIDALHAVVTTQDGRTFSTSDAGVTWVAR